MRDIKNLTIDELVSGLKKSSVPSYRASQIFDWLYKKNSKSFDDMKNIPRELKDLLGANYYIGSLKEARSLKSYDGTEKFVFSLSDDYRVETVFIPSKDRRTLCISTQAGCKFGCKFCASGKEGFKRNLTSSEILSQILSAREKHPDSITNYVFMGMGEPLDNFENLKKAVAIMNSPEGVDIGARRITVSTCGIVPGIKRFRELGSQVNLSVSLHAADDKLRNSLLPVNRKYPLEKLVEVCGEYVRAGGRKLTLEYVLIEGVNDSAEDAEKLSKMAGRLRAKVNLIPYSEIPGKRYTAPAPETVKTFRQTLAKNKRQVTVRESKGKDINAACGQLAFSECS